MPEQILPRRKLGDTGLDLSILGLGTVKFGRNSGVKYPSSFDLPSDQTLIDLLALCRDLGITYLDTAPAYGTSEIRLGNIPAELKREFTISTKVGEYFTNDVSHYDFSAAATTASVSASLRALGVPRLDIVFVHSDGQDQHVIEDTDVLETLQKLKDKGDIGAIGFSGKLADQSSLAVDLVDLFMIALNEQDTSQKSLIELCQQKNKGVIIKKALASGHAVNPSQALRFAAEFPGVTSVIVGTINPAHLSANAAAVTSLV